MSTRTLIALLIGCVSHAGAFGDEVLYRYEGDVLPYDESAGWVIADPCETPCSESLEDGHFVLRWGEFSQLANYDLSISSPGGAPPPKTLWVEWHFRSNNPIPRTSFSCDANFKIQYGGMFELVWLFSDAAVSFSGDDFLLGLDGDAFHTYRFESLDGINYSIAVDGLLVIIDDENQPNGHHFLQLAGRGGCDGSIIPRINEWDFVRYGTISYGEQVMGSDPPGGFLDPRRYPSLDRFTVTFDSPNYVYLEDITVEVADSLSSLDQENLSPSVIQTRRLDNGDPEVVEIVLDRPIPTDGRTVFTLSDGVAVNTVQYTYIQGDVNADGAFDLADLAELGNCFGVESPTGRCYAFDFDDNGLISLSDYAILHALLTGP